MEEIDGFFAALICSPDVARPSEYLLEIWGGDAADEEVFANPEEFQSFANLLFRHWNRIVHVLREEEVFLPCLLEDQDGIAHANDWARGFIRGTLVHHESWSELFNNEEHGGALIPILVLAHENDPDPEMRPYYEPIDVPSRNPADRQHGSSS